MLENGFREGKKIEDEEESKDVLLKQLEIAHKRELEFGKYIMLIKGWAVTLFSALLLIYFAYLKPEDKNFIILLLFILPFFLLWIIEALIGAYQVPYYKAITNIENELMKKENNRKLIPLTYQNQKNAYLIVGKNILKCAFHLSVFPFYVLPIIALLLLWLFSLNVNGIIGTDRSLILIFLGILVNLALIIVNIVVAYFIFRQVKAAELENQKSVMPILGITLSKDISGELTDLLYVYVQYNIALKISCNVNIDNEIIFSEFSQAAIPPNNESRLVIWNIEKSKEYISTTDENKRITFKTNFTYESVLGDKYGSEYWLTAWKDKNNKIQKIEELISWKLPWDC